MAKGSTIIHLHYGDIKNVEVELPDLKTQLYLVGVVKRLRTKFFHRNRLSGKTEQGKTIFAFRAVHINIADSRYCFCSCIKESNLSSSAILSSMRDRDAAVLDCSSYSGQNMRALEYALK